MFSIDNIRNYMDSHKKMNYVCRFLPPFRSEMFFELVAQLTRRKCGVSINPNLHFQSFGELNKDKALYVVNRGFSGGFMYLYNLTIGVFTACDLYGLNPVVHWENLLCPRDSAGYVSNAYEYYFQPLEVTYEDALNSSHVAFCDPWSCGVHYTDYTEIGFDHYVVCASKAIKRFAHFNKVTEEYITKRIASVLEGKKTLGVHVRGGMFKAKLRQHPVAAEPSEFIAEAKKSMIEHGFERIFLATDEEDTVTQFKSAFGDIVVCYSDIIRVQPGIISDHSIIALELKDTQPDNGFRMGLEVLTDVYTLAACQGLIAGLSYVPIVAMFINGGEYEYRHVINKGVYGYDVPPIRGRGDKIQNQYRKMNKAKLR